MMRQNYSYRFGGPITKNVRNLMIINAAVFLLQQIFNLVYPGAAERIFGLSHIGLFYEFKVWQIFTYMFLHGGILHIFFNLLVLWMFGGELEQLWGEREFLKYYIFCGLGAGVFIAFMNFFIYARYGYTPITIGASGALYGILLAYGITWPNREVMLYFIIPLKVKYFVTAVGIIEFLGTISSAAGAGGSISHIGHVGGIISGFLYVIHRKRKSNKSFLNFSSVKKEKATDLLMKEKLKRKQQEIERRIKAKKTIDSLLEKIAKDGMDSLSRKEKRDLEWARKHYYPDEEDTLH